MLIQVRLSKSHTSLTALRMCVCVCLLVGWSVVWTDHLPRLIEDLGVRASVAIMLLYTCKLEHHCSQSPSYPASFILGTRLPIVPTSMKSCSTYLVLIQMFTFPFLPQPHSVCILGMRLIMLLATCLHYILVARLIFCSGEEQGRRQLLISGGAQLLRSSWLHIMRAKFISFEIDFCTCNTAYNLKAVFRLLFFYIDYNKKILDVLLR